MYAFLRPSCRKHRADTMAQGRETAAAVAHRCSGSMAVRATPAVNGIQARQISERSLIVEIFPNLHIY